MTTIKETFNKIYENKDVHIWLFVILLIGALLSSLYDIAAGTLNTHKQNIIDFIVGILISACSIQFLHNVLHNENDGEIPLFSRIKACVYLKTFAVNIFWALMVASAAIILIMVMLPIFYAVSSAGKATIILAASILTILAVFIFSFYVYVPITLADTMSVKKSINPKIIFRAIVRVFGQTYVQLFKYIGMTILFIIAFIILYILAEIVGLASIIMIDPNCSLFDIFMLGVAWYFLFILWFFMFPYSLLETYRDKLKPTGDNYENA